jgi:hypothetical protein
MAYTGPSEDHTSGSGSYLFIELSAPNSPNVGPFFLQGSVAQVASVSFAYHLHGSTMGTLGLNTSTDGGSTWVKEWRKKRRPRRRMARRNRFPHTASSTEVRFWGVTVGGTSDKTLGDVSIDLTTTPTQVPTPAYAFGQVVTNQRVLELLGVAAGASIFKLILKKQFI